MSILKDTTAVAVQFICVIVTMLVTAVTSNTATASIFLPIIAGLVIENMSLNNKCLLKYLNLQTGTKSWRSSARFNVANHIGLLLCFHSTRFNSSKCDCICFWMAKSWRYGNSM